MEERLLALAGRFWLELETMAGKDRTSGVYDVAGFLYSAPLAVVGLVWLVAATDLALIRAEWPMLATAVGPVSPFCSLTVVPIVAAALISGVPLAPLMSFWIASPSMDPEMFFQSVAALGWELAVWRLVATLLLSVGAGLATHFVTQRGWLGPEVLRTHRPRSAQLIMNRLQVVRRRLNGALSTLPSLGLAPLAGSRSSSRQPAVAQPVLDREGVGSLLSLQQL